MEHLSHPCQHHVKKNDAETRSKFYSRLIFSLLGLASIVWLLVRIIPKPSRAEYPCMKVAAPIAGGFIASLFAPFVALYSFRKAGRLFRQSRYVLAAALGVCALIAAGFGLLKTDDTSDAMTLATDSLFVPSDLPNTPVGTARGIAPGRVVWMWDSTAARWDGTSNYWWTEQYTHQAVVDSMFSKSLCALTNQSTTTGAWTSLFQYFNVRHNKGAAGYQPGEKIAIKINLNNSSDGETGHNLSFAAPQAVLAVLRSLVHTVGVAPADISIYDCIRYVPDAIYTPCHAEFPDMHFVGWSNSNKREQRVRDTTTIHWSQPLTEEINGGDTVYLPTVVTKASYLINLATLKGHRYMGVTMCAKNHFGTLCVNENLGNAGLNSPHAAGVHFYSAVHDIVIAGSPEWTFTGRPMGSYNPMVDLMGNKYLGGNTLLFMVEALYAVETEGVHVSLASRWKSAPFNNHWTSSIFLSQDEVALESVGIDFIRNEASVNTNYATVYGSVDNFLHEAARADNPPSGTFYHPNGDTVRLPSLGVHEHWNNPTDRQYTRNLGTGLGIELVSLTGGVVTSVPTQQQVPSRFALAQNYPNPFNPSTNIGYTIASSKEQVAGSAKQVGMERVNLVVYDLLGREVAVLVDGYQTPGEHRVTFDARRLSSGEYFYKLTAGNNVQTRKMVLVK